MNVKPKADPMIGGKSLDEWDEEWVDVAGGFRVKHPQLTGMSGLYRGDQDGEVMVLGKASGMRSKNHLSKRLDDFRRPGVSGRDDPAGTFIYANRDRMRLQVLVTGDNADAAKVASKLKGWMLVRHKPRMNSPKDVVMKAAFG
jgi:hypothetical protein